LISIADFILKFKSRIIIMNLKYFPSVCSGLLLFLAFPGAELWPLAFVAMVPWFVSMESMSEKSCFYTGLVTGFIWFAGLLYWIIPTLDTYGGLNPGASVSILCILCFYLSLYPAMFAFLLKKTHLPPWIRPLYAGCLWTSLEYIRAHAFTGFPWGELGYSQYRNLGFIQIADIAGVYGVSFVIVAVNCAFAQLVSGFKKNCVTKNLVSVMISTALVICTMVYGHLKINRVEKQMKTASKASVMVVQGNINQDIKWSREFKTKTVEKYIRLTAEGLKSASPDLVVWPETALPFYYGPDRKLSDRVDQCIRKSKTNFLVGTPAFESGRNGMRYYNRACMINRFSIVTGIYDKTHLVPFGEYVPFGRYLKFLGKLTAQAGDFSSGPASFEPLRFKKHKTGVLICFEIVFPHISSGFVKNGADILTTITNDAWFGTTSAPDQHFSIAVFRAVENRRSIARAANTGISGFIDPTGRILARTSLFCAQTLERTIPAMTEITFYTRHGDLFALGALVAICLAFMIKQGKKYIHRKTKENVQ